MSAIIVRPHSPRIIIPAPWLKERDEQRKRKPRSSTGLSVFTASIKASLVGAVGMFILFPAGLMPFEFLALLIIPGFIVLFLSVGMLGGIFAENVVKDYRQAGEVGWMAGFWTGVHGGNMAMMMAATGIYMNDFDQNVVNQFTVEQLKSLTAYGFGQSMLAVNYPPLKGGGLPASTRDTGLSSCNFPSPTGVAIISMALPVAPTVGSKFSEALSSRSCHLPQSGQTQEV